MLLNLYWPGVWVGGINFVATRTNLIPCDSLLTLAGVVDMASAKVNRLSEGIRFLYCKSRCGIKLPPLCH